MIDFIITGFPRSGTTWLANYLSTDDSICHHDPLNKAHYRDWNDRLGVMGKKTGVSCTGIWRWPEWLNEQSSKKVVIHRKITDVRSSMHRIGLPPIPTHHRHALKHINALHIEFDTLFTLKQIKLVTDYLEVRWQPDRAAELLKMRIEPKPGQVNINQALNVQLKKELFDKGQPG